MIRCMLVDDDDDDRDIFQMAMERVALPVEYNGVGDSRIAMSFIKGLVAIPQYIFLDLNMPGLSGIDLLELLKADEVLKNVPVIIYSTSADPIYEMRIKELNAAHYFMKPVRVEKLATILTKIFSKEDLPFFLNEKNF